MLTLSKPGSNQNYPSNENNMCGVAGAFATIQLEGLVRAVEKMTVALTHRGPDDQGISDFGFRNADFKSGIRDPQCEVCVVLGVRRLAIIDLSSAGHQPMQDEGAGLTIAYNGETYNFRELREEIGEEFGPWRSNTDTEVVLRAYRKWGLRAFQKLRGMFAVAIWDAGKQELILARDPFGIKPLYYYTGIADCGLRNSDLKSEIRSPKSEFLFASEVRALLASDLVPRKLSVDGVSSYLNYGSVEAPLTIVEGVRSLMPGHYMVVRSEAGATNIEETSYIHGGTLDFGRTLDGSPPRSRKEAVALLRGKLEESVRLHLVSDVPLGVFLSGGMDSSALVALMSQVTNEKPRTFSIVFDEDKFSEAPHSRLVAETFRTDHCEICLPEDQLFGLLPAALGAMDQPTMDGVNTFVVSRAVKEAGVTVALSGLGGDELFAGYPSFRRALRLRDLRRFSEGLRGSASTVGRAVFSGSTQQQKFWQLVASDGSPQAAYSITRQLFAPEDVENLITFSLPRHHRCSEEDFKPRLASSNSRRRDPVNAMSLLEMRGYMANTLLRDTDSMSMAHSLEVRVPFVDAEVASFVLSLPGRWKLNGSNPKPMLRDAVKDLFSVDFLKRPKMGFRLPFEVWMQSRLREEISEVLGDRKQFENVGLNAETVIGVWQRFLRRPRAVGWSRPWALYVLAKWCTGKRVSF